LGLAALAVPVLSQPAYASGSAGDDFRFANIIVGSRGGTHISNVGSTAEPGEPSHAKTPDLKPDKPDHSTWFSWTAPASGRMIFRTKGSSFDTVMAAYTGSSLTSLTQLASNDDVRSEFPFERNRSQIAFVAQAGVNYHIAVDSFTGAQAPDQVQQGRIHLSWDGNDDFAHPIALNPSGSVAFSDNDGATLEPGEPVHSTLGGKATASEWFTFRSSKDGKLRFNVQSSAFPASLAVYSGTSLTNLKQLGSAVQGDPVTNGTVTVTAKANTTYRIAVAGQGAGSEGDIVLVYGYL
ncbi:MAG: hypothetical protein ABWY56_09655, partial [Propionibacteriaceae bacterium]